VLFALSDVFRSILLPRATARTFRLGPLLGATFGPPWAFVADRIADQRRRQAFRGALAPLLLVISLLTWIALLILGFGLLMSAARHRFDPALTGYGDAFYQAASSFLTLGLSGVTAAGSARIVTVLAGLAGLATVTIVASFLLSVQSALHRREVLVLGLAAAAGRPPSGLAILESYARLASPSELAQLFKAWQDWAADVLHSHRAYPILAEFRSTDEDDEWLASLSAVLDAAVLLLAAVDDREAKPAQSAARLFLPIGCRTAHDLARQFAVKRKDSPDPSFLREEFRVARRRLAAASYQLAADERAGYETLLRLREGHAGAMAGLAHHLGIAITPGLLPAGEPPPEVVREDPRKAAE
jgi:hypothetical protein